MMYFCNGFFKSGKLVECPDGFNSWGEIPEDQCDGCYHRERGEYAAVREIEESNRE